MYLSLNGVLISDEIPLVCPYTSGFLYGYGLFETLKVTDKKIEFFEEHLRRMALGCEMLDMSPEYKTDAIERYARDLLGANRLSVGSLKILYARNRDRDDLIIMTGEKAYYEQDYVRGFKLCISATRRNASSKLTYIKSNNYMENILAKREAQKKGYDEALFLNTDNFVSEGSYTNIFFVRSGIIYTPAVSCGLLPGIIREKVIELAKTLSIRLETGEYSREDLLLADEVFLSNSLMGIMPVSRIGDTRFDLGKSPTTTSLREAFANLQR